VQIAGLDRLVAEVAAPFAGLIARLVTIPGSGQRTAEAIVAETDGDMARFATAARLAAWAGLAPGDNESAAKRKKAPTLIRATGSYAWPWWKPPGATWRTATRSGARFRRLDRGSARATRRRPRSPSRTPC